MPAAKPLDQTIAAEVGSVAVLDLPSLRAKWRRRWGEPPRFRSRELMARALAHRLQVEAFGDLPSPIQRRAKDLAERFMADRSFTPATATALLPGSSLIREWRGARHEVAVLADGFLYKGEMFGSLSRVAHRITGTKWNGPVFFGLKRRGKAA